jgi:MerR family mercuric resistance operon transcriptional regulator
MRTRELATRAGVNPQTLRYYERIGLLADPPRTAGGYRDYPPEAVRLLGFVRRAKELGFQLDEIEELLALQNGGGTCATVRGVAERRAADLDRRIADLQRMRDALVDLTDRCAAGPAHDHACPILDTLEAPHDPPP